MVPIVGHPVFVLVMRTVDRAGVVRPGDGNLRQVGVVGQVGHPVGITFRGLLRLRLHVADRERITVSGLERCRGRVAVGLPLRRDGGERKPFDVLRQHERRDRDLRPCAELDIGDVPRHQVQGQHVRSLARDNRAPVGFDVEREAARYGAVFARQHELLYLRGFRESHLDRNRGHQRAESEGYLRAAFHPLGACRHIGVLHVAFAVVVGLYGRDSRHDDRAAVGLHGVCRIEGVKIVAGTAPPLHPRVAQVGFAFGRPGDADFDFRPLRGRLRADDPHPVGVAPVDRVVAVL
ncbi:unknown [Alistipes sp. CAG:29]|nr:unknown [Alistipes sp. CAG:29]